MYALFEKNWTPFQLASLVIGFTLLDYAYCALVGYGFYHYNLLPNGENERAIEDLYKVAGTFFLIVSILPAVAIVEETICRIIPLAITVILTEKRRMLAVGIVSVISSILFGLAHGANLFHLIMQRFGGILYSFAYLLAGGYRGLFITPSCMVISMHWLFNSGLVIAKVLGVFS